MYISCSCSCSTRALLRESNLCDATKKRIPRARMPHSGINHQALTVRLGNTPEWPSALPWQPPHFSNTLSIMSQTSENNQSSSYYPPAQFPSLSMAGQYSYPPPEGQGTSPSGANMTLPPALSLPPIHTIDGRPQPQQQQQGQGQGQQGAQTQIPPGMPPAMGQYYGQGQPFPPTSDPSQPMRYPIPPDGRVMSGGRHKKEIKRRTKTGCLTCRKRRIKVCRWALRSSNHSPTPRAFTLEGVVVVFV